MSPLGARINHVPLVGDQAILPASGCWNTFTASGLTGTPYRGPLTEIPHTGTYRRLATRGFVAVPLATIKAMAKTHR